MASMSEMARENPRDEEGLSDLVPDWSDVEENDEAEPADAGDDNDR